MAVEGTRTNSRLEVEREGNVRESIIIEEDFLGDDDPTTQGDKIGANLCLRVVGAGPPVGSTTANVAGGVFTGLLENTSQVQVIGVDHNDSLTLDMANLLVFEARVRIITGDTVATTENLMVGLASAHANDEDTITESVWLKLLGGMSWFAETDDGTNETSTDTTIDATAGTFQTIRIVIDQNADSTASDVSFYIDDVRVLASTVFNISDAATGLVQPYVAINKTAAAGITSFQCDWIRVYNDRQ